MAATTEDILDRLIDIQDNTGESFKRLEHEVRELKDQRYKPYFASAGAFLLVVMGVMTYVYALETRLNALLFEINASVQVTQERVNVTEERLALRSENIKGRWTTHSLEHSRISRGFALLLEEHLKKDGINSEDLKKFGKD